MEDDKRLTSKLDCKEIKINKIKEKPAIQSPGSSPPPAPQREPGEFSEFQMVYTEDLGVPSRSRDIKRPHAWVCVCFLCSVGHHTQGLGHAGSVLCHRRPSLTFMFEALELLYGRRWTGCLLK